MYVVSKDNLRFVIVVLPGHLHCFHVHFISKDLLCRKSYVSALLEYGTASEFGDCVGRT